MSSEDRSHEWEKLANIHNEGHKAIEKEIGQTVGNIRTEIKSATVLHEMWTHHLIQHTCSEAGGGTQVFLVSEQLREAITARESLQHHTERFILLQSILNLKRQQNPAIPASINIEGGNIRETVTKHLKKLEENIGDMQYELKQAESLVNTERLCMDEIKKLVKTMDQKVRSIVPPSHHSTPAVMSPRQGLETDKGNGLDDKPKVAGEAGPTLIRGKERKRPISKNPSPEREALNAKDPAPHRSC
ncbi:unnamed protein product [Heligmosomoides polygyrus]|uniref:CEP63 domain-containing protein n=1 Tax=Heligmosomoides polygyrus TaxID=6339 RepID=A0A183GRG7_HELPZ|nr:unnamed protein product [Heligmosomoides polygyrus]